MSLDDHILGKGVYTPREAARLVGINPQQVLNWTRGNTCRKPLWNAHYQFLDDDITDISFLDLIEVRVVSAMRKANISLQSIRFAISIVQDKFEIERPLVSQSFKTDGPEILMEAIEQDGNQMSLSRTRPGQKVFTDIVSQSLNDIEYEEEVVVRWRPENHTTVVLDPSRHFGVPILDQFGISTGTIYKEFNEFKDMDYLSNIYEFPKKFIEKCIKFEFSLDRKHGQGII